MLVRILFVLFFISCIEKKAANPLLLFSLTTYKETPIAVYAPNAKWEGCVLDYITANRKLTLCLNIPPESCKASVLLNIKDTTILQNRKDDLTFISLNYPNCSGGAPTLQGIYNVMATPASLALQRQAGITSSLSESSFTVSFRSNCDFMPQTQKPFTLEELTKINRVEAELGMQTITSSQCLTDLGISSDIVSLVNEIRSDTRRIISICSHLSGDSVAQCAW